MAKKIAKSVIKRKQESALITLMGPQKLKASTRAPFPAHLRKPPLSHLEQNELADAMMKWLQEDDNRIELEDFPLSLRYSPKHFFACRKENIYFEQALSFCHSLIGSRILKLWRSYKVDKAFVDKILPLYHQEYKEYISQKLELSQKAYGHAMASFAVQMPPIPSSDDVPVLPKADT